MLAMASKQLPAQAAINEREHRSSVEAGALLRPQSLIAVAARYGWLLLTAPELGTHGVHSSLQFSTSHCMSRFAQPTGSVTSEARLQNSGGLVFLAAAYHW
jgi:hypothetical protein